LENLKIIYKNSCNCVELRKVVKGCEICVVFQNTIYYVIKTLTKFSMGKDNLEALLSSQNCAYDRVSIGYKLVFQNKVKQFKNLFSFKKSNTSPFTTCFYCMRNGHTIKNDKIRKFDVPKGLFKWMPKGVRGKVVGSKLMMAYLVT